MTFPHSSRSWIALLALLLFVAFGCGKRGDDSSSKSESGSAPDSAEVADAEGSSGGDSGGDSGGKSGNEKNQRKKNGKDGDEEEAETPVPVDVTVVERGSIESVVRSAANLEAESQVEVASEASRRVRELLVEEGQSVKKGQVLLRLQNDEQRSNLAKAQVAFEQAEREHERQQKLWEQDLTSEQRLTDSARDYDQQKLAVADAERELSYTEVRAPISGTITNRLVNLGDQVQIGQRLFDIIDFESIVARVYIPEKHLDQLRPGLPARITVQTGSERRFDAKVDRIAPIVDPQSGTVKTTVAIGRQPGLLPGMYVDVDLVTAVHESAILIPKRALVYDGDQIFAYRLAPERRVERIRILPILTDRDNIEPLDGLSEGDTIVVAGQAGLKDGALVRLPGDKKEAEDEEESKDSADSESS